MIRMRSHQELKEFSGDLTCSSVHMQLWALVVHPGKDYYIDGWNTRFCQLPLGEDFNPKNATQT